MLGWLEYSWPRCGSHSSPGSFQLGTVVTRCYQALTVWWLFWQTVSNTAKQSLTTVSQADSGCVKASGWDVARVSARGPGRMESHRVMYVPTYPLYFNKSNHFSDPNGVRKQEPGLVRWQLQGNRICGQRVRNGGVSGAGGAAGYRDDFPPRRIWSGRP